MSPHQPGWRLQRAEDASTQPGVPPRQFESSPQPQEIASAGSQDDDFPLSNLQVVNGRAYLSANAIAHTRKAGVLARGARAAALLVGNTITHSQQAGVYLYDSCTATLLGNEIGASSGAGVLLAEQTVVAAGEKDGPKGSGRSCAPLDTATAAFGGLIE